MPIKCEISKLHRYGQDCIIVGSFKAGVNLQSSRNF